MQAAYPPVGGFFVPVGTPVTATVPVPVTASALMAARCYRRQPLLR